jgi:hypothetical protein
VKVLCRYKGNKILFQFQGDKATEKTMENHIINYILFWTHDNNICDLLDSICDLHGKMPDFLLMVTSNDGSGFRKLDVLCLKSTFLGAPYTLDNHVGDPSRDFRIPCAPSIPGQRAAHRDPAHLADMSSTTSCSSPRGASCQSGIRWYWMLSDNRVSFLLC